MAAPANGSCSRTNAAKPTTKVSARKCQAHFRSPSLASVHCVLFEPTRLDCDFFAAFLAVAVFAVAQPRARASASLSGARTNERTTNPLGRPLPADYSAPRGPRPRRPAEQVARKLDAIWTPYESESCETLMKTTLSICISLSLSSASLQSSEAFPFHFAANVRRVVQSKSTHY